MLLNLSNHPSPLWPDNQQAAARGQFGEIADLPFPAIDPDCDTAEVEQMAAQYEALVAERLQGAAAPAVHLMGEMSFTVALTARLQRRGLPVYCSTTRRQVIEEKDGRKTTQFVFVRFRQYPAVQS
ncbi:MAG: CRISPR-associated protein [Saprospiraceae bacterium]|nr:CRISPR-associated protein [Saprospiraceae bacterium]